MGKRAWVAMLVSLTTLAGCGSGGAGRPDAGSTATTGDGATSQDGSGASRSADATTANDGPAEVDATPNGDATGAPDGFPAADDSVVQYHNHIDRDGLFVDGAFTQIALASGKLHVDTTFDGSGITGEVRASPLFAARGFGDKPTLFVADESDNVYAFDAATGALLATKNFGAGPQIEPCGQGHTIGIRGTPAIDVASGVLVFDAATADTTGHLAKHTIYALGLRDLATRWSLDVSTVRDPVAGPFLAQRQNQRGAVLIVGGIAYIAYGGFYGDCGDTPGDNPTYRGWVVGVPLVAGPAGAKAYATPSPGSGIWGPGGLASDGTNVYAATGNGPTQSNGAWGGAFALLRFEPGPVFSGTSNDYWVAVNDNGDEDLGGSGPLVIDEPGTSPMIVQLGKDGFGYLLDGAKALGGPVSPSLGSAPLMNDEITCGPAWARVAGKVYVAMLGNGANGGASCPKGTSGGLVVVTVDPAGATPFTTAWCAPNSFGSPIITTSDITTSDGTNDPLVWTAATAGRNDGPNVGAGQIYAWNLATGAPVVTGSDAMAGLHHFTSPIVVRHRMFVVGSRLYALRP